MTEMKQIVTVLVLIGTTLGGGAYAQQGGVQAQQGNGPALSGNTEAQPGGVHAKQGNAHAVPGGIHAQQGGTQVQPISYSEFISQPPDMRDWSLLQEMRSGDASLLQEMRSEARFNADFREETRTSIREFRAEVNDDIGRLWQTMVGMFVTAFLAFGGAFWALILRMDKRFGEMDRKFDAVIMGLNKAGIPLDSPCTGGGSPGAGGGGVPVGAG